MIKIKYLGFGDQTPEKKGKLEDPDGDREKRKVLIRERSKDYCLRHARRISLHSAFVSGLTGDFANGVWSSKN